MESSFRQHINILMSNGPNRHPKNITWEHFKILDGILLINALCTQMKFKN